MTDTFTRVAEKAPQARAEALARLAELGDAVVVAEEALTAARAERLEYMCVIAESKLLTNEQVFIAGRASRTTLYDELQARRAERDEAKRKGRGNG